MVTHEIFEVSSLFQVVATMAAIRAEVVSTPQAHRTLLICNNALIPELTHGLRESSIIENAGEFFDSVVYFNELTYPLGPSDFSPADKDLPLLKALLQHYLDIPHSAKVVLYLESIQANPARALARVFHEAELIIHADGLMVYGPARAQLPPAITSRISTVLYPEFIPGLRPLLVTAPTAQYVAVGLDHLREAVSLCAPPQRGESHPTGEYALVLGQYLATLNLLTPAEELDLTFEMITRAHEETGLPVVFKAHPSSPRTSTLRLERSARDSHIPLTIDHTDTIAEVLFAHKPPQLVVSAFSTALATAYFGYHIPVLGVGTELLLERFTPYQNSNRIPATIIDALFGDAPMQDPSNPALPIGMLRGAPPDPTPRRTTNSTTPHNTTPHWQPELNQLVRAVAYACQPDANPQLLPAAREYVQGHTQLVENHAHHQPIPLWRRYIKKKRAQAAGIIPTGSPAHTGRTALRTAGYKRKIRALLPNRVITTLTNSRAPKGASQTQHNQTQHKESQL